MATQIQKVEGPDPRKPPHVSDEEWSKIPETIPDEDLPKPIFYTEEEWREIREREAQENFGMSLDEFFEAWKAGEFDGKPEIHDDVISLAMTIPEYWKM